MAQEAEVEVYPQKSEVVEWRWRLQSENSEIVASGESHPSADAAAEAARTAVEVAMRACGMNGPNAANIAERLRVRRLDTDGALGYSDDELKGTTGGGEQYPAGEAAHREGGA